MKNRKKLEGANSESSDSSTVIILGVVASLAAAALYFFSKGKAVNVDLTKLQDYRNRTKAELGEMAKNIHELYALHGKSIDGTQLETAIQEFFNIEKSTNSNLAYKQIETRLAAESQNKELIYGRKYGLYGSDFVDDQNMLSLVY